MASAEELQSIKILKELILDQARAIHGPHYLDLSTFSVITSRSVDPPTLRGPSSTHYRAHLIVHLYSQSHGIWKLLVIGNPGPSTYLAMELLYQNLQDRVNGLICNMEEGSQLRSEGPQRPDASW